MNLARNPNLTDLMTLPRYRSFFSELVQCTKQKNLLRGRAVHARIVQTGSSSCVYLSNSLINFYAKCGDLSRAKRVFENIQDKDVVSWNCLINGYSQQGSKGSSFVMELFQQMRAVNVLPNAHTFAGVFTAASKFSDVFSGLQAHTLVIKTHSFHDVFVGSSLLNVYNPVSWSRLVRCLMKCQRGIRFLGQQ
ncbi:hypothetical protein CRYUN_Cryun28dG0113100 [Craigia yunnanensis]